MELGQLQMAVRFYSEAINLNPLDAEAYPGRGDAYNDLGQYDQVILDYDHAARINPENADAYYKRGLERSGLPEFRLALEKQNEVP